MTNQKQDLYKTFEESFAKKATPEEKVEHALEFMKEVIAQEGNPRMKDFWDAKNLCIEAFKEKMNPVKRKVLWDQYTELTTEAKRLKAILDENSAFNVEQIELALQGLSKEIENREHATSKVKDLNLGKFLARNREAKEWNGWYKELFVLNALSAQLTGLRKEIIKTEMRIKHKNRLLEFVNSLSDIVFPLRRDLLQSLSDSFVLAVESFAAGRMKEDVSPFMLKDDIKSFQSVSKQISLTSTAFKKTREVLSKCWETVMEKEKGANEERSKLIEEQKEVVAALEEEITAFEESEKTKAACSELIKKVKDAKLERRTAKTLLDRLFVHEKAFKDAAKAAKEQKEKEKAEKLAKIIDALENAEGLDADGLSMLHTDVEQGLEELAVSETHRMRIHFLLQKVAADVYLANESYEKLADLTKDLKTSFQKLRKESGSSALDFERGIILSELLEDTRSLLDHIQAKQNA